MSADVNQVAADLAKLKADLAAKAAAEEHKATRWLKGNWLHIANGAGIGVALLKIFGKL